MTIFRAGTTGQPHKYSDFGKLFFTKSLRMKPASGQFRIEYQNGQNYEPDFVVECATHYLLVEPKRADQIDTAEVQLKARAASRWCGYANEHAKNNDNKLCRAIALKF